MDLLLGEEEDEVVVVVVVVEVEAVVEVILFERISATVSAVK